MQWAHLLNLHQCPAATFCVEHFQSRLFTWILWSTAGQTFCQSWQWGSVCIWTSHWFLQPWRNELMQHALVIQHHLHGMFESPCWNPIQTREHVPCRGDSRSQTTFSQKPQPLLVTIGPGSCRLLGAWSTLFLNSKLSSRPYHLQCHSPCHVRPPCCFPCCRTGQCQ